MKYHVIDKNAKLDEKQKLIIELVDLLNDTTRAFMELNKKHGNVLPNVLKDASIGYAGSMIRTLLRSITKKEKIPYLKNQAKEMFCCYIDEIKETTEKRKKNGT